jgi:hypothetical protein
MFCVLWFSYEKAPRSGGAFICWIFYLPFYSTFCPADIQSLAGLYQDTNDVCIICRNIIKCSFLANITNLKIFFSFQQDLRNIFLFRGWIAVEPQAPGSR